MSIIAFCKNVGRIEVLLPDAVVAYCERQKMSIITFCKNVGRIEVLLPDGVVTYAELGQKRRLSPFAKM